MTNGSKLNLSESEKAAIREGRSRRANDEMKIPQRYRRSGLHNFEGLPANISDAIAALHRGESVFITGPCGSGKTRLGVALLNVAFAENWRGKDFRALFVGFPELLQELRGSFSGEAGSENEIIRRYQFADLLLIDDLGSEKITEWSRQEFFTILYHRYNEMLPTIVTSNLTLKRIEELADDRIASRLAGDFVLKLEREDYRLNQMRARAV